MTPREDIVHLFHRARTTVYHEGEFNPDWYADITIAIFTKLLDEKIQEYLKHPFAEMHEVIGEFQELKEELIKEK